MKSFFAIAARVWPCISSIMTSDSRSVRWKVAATLPHASSSGPFLALSAVSAIWGGIGRLDEIVKGDDACSIGLFAARIFPNAAFAWF